MQVDLELVADAGVVTGLGAVPLGQWHGPQSDGRCRRRPTAREAVTASTFRHANVRTTHGTSHLTTGVRWPADPMEAQTTTYLDLLELTWTYL